MPKGARDLFGIRPGDTLLLLTDAEALTGGSHRWGIARSATVHGVSGARG
ncbi:hypothetical protein [Actinoplanes utahensis]|nr:hypothetical protein [Actinoplanes utahensis]